LNDHTSIRIGVFVLLRQTAGDRRHLALGLFDFDIRFQATDDCRRGLRPILGKVRIVLKWHPNIRIGILEMKTFRQYA